MGMFIAFVLLVPSGALAPPAGKAAASGLTDEERWALSQIDYDYAWSELEYLSSLGEKVTGNPEEISAQRYVYDRLSALPVDEVKNGQLLPWLGVDLASLEAAYCRAAEDLANA